MKSNKITILIITLVLIIALVFIINGCKKEEVNTAPVASFTIEPEQGTTDNMFTFDAGSCTDNEEDGSTLEVCWDWESDGTWDTQFSTIKIVHQRFAQPGTYTITLNVKDSKGLTATTSKELVVVDATSGTIIDNRDDKTYNTIKIGQQWWMAENLNFETTSGSMCYGDDPENCENYGRLYNWMTAVTVCPDGWHLPSDSEWKQLEQTLGMSSDDLDAMSQRESGQVGKKLKSTTGWELNGNGNNSSKFNALPTGVYLSNKYMMTGQATFFHADNNEYTRYLSAPSDGVMRIGIMGTMAASVRCLKN